MTPEIVYGAANVAELSTEELNATLAVLRAYNVKSLDTAHLYVCFPQRRMCPEPQSNH